MSRVYKMVASVSKFHTINQRLKECAQKFDTHYDELMKATADLQKWDCPKKIEEAVELFKAGYECKTSVQKLFHDCEHFKLHEEPKLMSRDMLKGYVLPSVAAITLATLIGEIAYKKKLKDKYQVIQKVVSAGSAKQL